MIYFILYIYEILKNEEEINWFNLTQVPSLVKDSKLVSPYLF